MSTASTTTEIIYPDSDGEPIAENTLQFRCIHTLYGGLVELYRDRPDVFVAADLLWYPLEGNNTHRLAPDAMVVFGRPKGDRGSYMQWREDGIAPQVVFEILSPGNRAGELENKRQFYERHGVEEYYLYDPDRLILQGWLRHDDHFRPIAEMDGWMSPRLGILFELGGEELPILSPDGRPFSSYGDLLARSDRDRALAERERERAENERERADRESREKDLALERARRLAEQLRALGIEPEA